MIYCIWYPSGGFGHFINSILSIYGQNFVRPTNKTVEFSENGNAHSVELVAPKYKSSLENYNFVPAEPNKNYSVLIDNGINNESEEFKKFFPGAQILKICYSNQTWPVIARTMIDKAMNSRLEEQLPVNAGLWDHTSNWAKREKYFLFLRDHSLRHQWKPSTGNNIIFVDDLLCYETLARTLCNIGIQTDDFNELWNQWYSANIMYIRPVVYAEEIINNIKHNRNQSLSDVTDLWTQAVIYYFLWLEFGKEVPHNDYADFFDSTSNIRKWLQL